MLKVDPLNLGFGFGLDDFQKDFEARRRHFNELKLSSIFPENTVNRQNKFKIQVLIAMIAYTVFVGVITPLTPHLIFADFNAGRFQRKIRLFFESKETFIFHDFIKEFPRLELVAEVICNPENINIRPSLVNALYVFSGIKPVFVIERGIECDSTRRNIEMLVSIFLEFSDLKFIKHESGDWYLINENPLREFHPARFIDGFKKKYGCLEDAVIWAFSNQNQMETDQLLSYLLGFGPTWESYAGITRRPYLKSHKICSIFSEQHYFQLGNAIEKVSGNLKKLSRIKYIELGKKHHLNVSSYNWPSMMSIIVDLPQELQDIERFYMQQMIDKISYQTKYIQKGMSYRKRLLALFKQADGGNLHQLV